MKFLGSKGRLAGSPLRGREAGKTRGTTAKDPGSGVEFHKGRLAEAPLHGRRLPKLIGGKLLEKSRRSNSWWREAVFYEIAPISFQDSNGDGKGDLPGLS